MLIKLGIIAGIVILAGMIFSTEIDALFPTTSASVFDSLKDDVSSFGDKASNSVEKRLDNSFDSIVDNTSNTVSNGINEAGTKISSEIAYVKDSSQKIINEEISNFNPLDPVLNFFTDNSNSETSQSSNPPSTTSTTNTQNQSPIIYETLSLSTKQQSDENILLQYYDSSKKTISVNVIIRTEQKEIFSGTFFTSMFETIVNDAASVPYYIDMIVEHEEYGTVTSSVFNPGDDSDSKINGIFS